MSIHYSDRWEFNRGFGIPSPIFLSLDMNTTININAALRWNRVIKLRELFWIFLPARSRNTFGILYCREWYRWIQKTTIKKTRMQWMLINRNTIILYINIQKDIILKNIILNIKRNSVHTMYRYALAHLINDTFFPKKSQWNLFPYIHIYISVRLT